MTNILNREISLLRTVVFLLAKSHTSSVKLQNPLIVYFFSWQFDLTKVKLNRGSNIEYRRNNGVACSKDLINLQLAFYVGGLIKELMS